MKPIAMKCSLEQYENISLILEQYGLTLKCCSDFDGFPYLVNNDNNIFGVINNYGPFQRHNHGRTVFEEWDKDIFLEYCGIKTKSFKLLKRNT